MCLALAAALARFGVPEEILTDNGKQFTDRFGQGGEVLFDKICRRNGIAHRLTKPRSPTTTGKVERFHRTLRLEFLDDAGPFTSLADGQAAIDGWVAGYNSERPHQSLDASTPVTWWLWRRRYLSPGCFGWFRWPSPSRRLRRPPSKRHSRDHQMDADLPAREDVQLLEVLYALSDPIRLEMVRKLNEAERALACGELLLPVSKSTASHHQGSQ